MTEDYRGGGKEGKEKAQVMITSTFWVFLAADYFRFPSTSDHFLPNFWKRN